MAMKKIAHFIIFSKESNKKKGGGGRVNYEEEDIYNLKKKE
jgi:hypothetical protein